MTSLVRLLAAFLALMGVTSCGGAAAADWQSLALPGVGALRVRHAHQLGAGDTAAATVTAQTLIQWTRSSSWDQLKTLVDDTHPLVIQFKAGDLLILTPEDSTLPVIWLSLGKAPRALLEDRKSGEIAIFDLPPGKSINLSWLGL